MDYSAPKPARTRVTLVGLRAALEQMARDLEDDRWDLCKATVFTEGGHPLSLALDRSGAVLELALSSDLELGEDSPQDPFRSALARHFGEPDARMSVALMDASFKSLRTEEDALPGALEVIQRVLDLEICGCGRSVKPAERIVCTTCVLECGEEDAAKHTCGVCKDLVVAPIERTKCCGQHIHSACARRCSLVSTRCPFCRADVLGEDTEM